MPYLREHKAWLLGQQDLVHFALFDQLNTPAAREHFQLLSTGWNLKHTHTHTSTITFTYGHIWASMKPAAAIYKFKDQPPHYIYLMNLTNRDRSHWPSFMASSWNQSAHIWFSWFQRSAVSDLPYNSRYINTHFSVLALNLRAGRLEAAAARSLMLLCGGSLFQMSEIAPFS